MSFPETINPAVPTPSSVASQGAAEIAGIKQLLVDVFGLPVTPTAITGPAMAIAADGVPTLAAGALTSADPTEPLAVANKEYVDAAVAVLSTASLQSALNLRGTTTTTTIPVTASWLIIINPSSGAALVIKSFSATCTVVGTQTGSQANGRDQAAAFGGGALFHLYAIGGNSQTPALLASLNAPPAGPTLPGTYTSWAYLGSFYTDAPGNVQLMRLFGNKVFWNGGPSQTERIILLNNNATAYTSVSLTNAAPAIALAATLALVLGVGTASTNQFSGFISLDATNAFGGLSVNAGNLNNSSLLSVEIPNSGTLYYKVSNADVNLTATVNDYTVPNGAS